MKLKGFFLTFERANEAMAKLKGAGFDNCHIEVDNNNRNIQRNLDDINSAYRLADFTVDPVEIKNNPLTAISPIINVKAGFSEFNDSNYRIIVDVDSWAATKAEDVIKSVGGTFKKEEESIGRVKQEVSELNLKFKENGI